MGFGYVDMLQIASRDLAAFAPCWCQDVLQTPPVVILRGILRQIFATQGQHQGFLYVPICSNIFPSFPVPV